MIGIALALLTAFAYGFSTVLVRKELDNSNFFSATLMITIVGNIILWPIALLFTNLGTVNPSSVPFFVVAGMLAPGIGRLFYFRGMEFVGVSVNASIIATYPLYSSIFAVLLMDEALTLENWIGIICIVVGVVFVVKSLSAPKAGPKRIYKKGLAFPILATLAIASSYLLRKYGLNICNEPLLGVAIGYSSAFLFYVLLLLFSPGMRGFMSLGKDFQLFWKPGVCLALGWVLASYALSYERVSIVTPLIQTEPLFILFLMHLHLKELERVSLRVVLNTLLIVIGIMLVSIR